MKQNEIEQAAKEANAYGYPNFNGEKHEAFNDGFLAGASFVNERQPYTKDGIISSINWLVENRFVICYDNKRWWWEKELDKTQKEYSTDDLFKLWEETRNG